MRLRFMWFRALFCGLAVCFAAGVCAAQSKPLGIGAFEGQTDVGAVSPPGMGAYDPGPRR